MRFITQFLLILAFSFAGELLHWLLPLPVPASIYGIALLFAALLKGWVRVSDVREVSTFLIAVMPVMFIPAAVGLVDSWPDISGHLVAYVAVTVVSTFVVMGVAGAVTQHMIRKGREDK